MADEPVPASGLPRTPSTATTPVLKVDVPPDLTLGDQRAFEAVYAGAGGDAGNDGASERGTAANPFNTVYEATFCAPAGGDVYIAPGGYNERFRLWRPMTLRRSGSSGVVTIGQ